MTTEQKVQKFNDEYDYYKHNLVTPIVRSKRSYYKWLKRCAKEAMNEYINLIGNKR